MDVKNAFLNGDIIEEVYVKPPHGYDHSPSQACKLFRALHGLKQAPQVWFPKFGTTITTFGFCSSPHKPGLFI